ncbi:aminoacyl tRNA synthase complex-interacting multifunctional protein 1 [Neodiprion fabricii]|uniref:aminoacyl tRNA synthase complex-interacting multifunctional protein 1 n=1 Tax=Neodiprion fabricii TaxID=2872261 RepID=UPI001ED8CA0D|nr:aminoacyl tRNA synthase complex-interacting multifunctional protein 1 [Neodiprion fabricii]
MPILAKNILPVCVRLNNLLTSSMASANVIKRLESKASAAEQIIAELKREVDQLKKGTKETYINETDVLSLENQLLRGEIEKYKNELVRLEMNRGVKQIPQANGRCSVKIDSKDISVVETAASTANENKPDAKAIKGKKASKEKGPGVKKPIAPTVESQEPPIDVGRLDFRIGRIVNAKKHPDADTLYVEEVDVGEEKNRTVVSGLVKYVPLEELNNKMVVLLCNLKPSKMRGVTSEAMVMCASTSDKVEILVPPLGAVPGDLVHVDGYPRAPDNILNSKKKIFETCAPDLMTDNERQAVYKGLPLHVPGKGNVVAPTLTCVQVK